MNLKNGQITVGEVLSNPNARALLQREYPALINHPMLGMARGMTLNQVREGFPTAGKPAV